MRRLVSQTNVVLGPLHLAYFAIQIILFRALMTPASMAAKYSPKSSLQRYFGAAMDEVGVFLSFMDGITPEGLRAFWGRRKPTCGASRSKQATALTATRWTISTHPHRQFLDLPFPTIF